MDSAFIELDDRKYRYIWDTFYKKFNFNPSIHENDFPGILEPTPSATYSIARIYESGEKEFEKLSKDLNDRFLQLFKSLTDQDTWVYALEWQKTSYKFFPHRPFELDEWDEWVIPILPNGDYYIFLEKNLEFGVFGHPWEKTMCIFGTKLIDLVKQHPPLLFDNPIRERL